MHIIIYFRLLKNPANRLLSGLSGFCLIFLSMLIISCGGGKVAQIWTDRPEFAIYGDYFNTAQDQYKVSVRYVDLPGLELRRARDVPDIIVGSRLKNNSTGSNFKPLDNLFGANKLSRSFFYQPVLAIGRIDRNQYLLPVSFNIPALIFSNNRDPELNNPFTIDFDEVKIKSLEFNSVSRGAYTRMGFSPLWSDNFLLTVAVLFGASFTEASPLVWDSDALEQSMEFVYNWTH